LDLAKSDLTTIVWQPLAPKGDDPESFKVAFSAKEQEAGESKPRSKSKSDDDDDGESNDVEVPEDFPALAVEEIARRILQLDPQDGQAFAGMVFAKIHDGINPKEGEDKETELNRYFKQWTSFGLPERELLNLQAEYKWETGHRDEAVSSWVKYVGTNTLDLSDVVRRRCLERITSYYLETRRWAELEAIINSCWSWENHALARVRRAKARLEQLKLDLAKKDYEEAKEAAPNLQEVIDLGPPLMRCLDHNDEWQAVKKKLQTDAGKAQPENWFNGAHVLLLMEKNPEALFQVEQAGKRLQGKSKAVDLMRVICLTRDNKDAPNGTRVKRLTVFASDIEEFEEWLNTNWDNLTLLLRWDNWILGNPAAVQGFRQRSALMRSFSQPLLALEDANAALRIDSSDPGALYLKGRCLLDLNRPKEALPVAALLKTANPAGFFELTAYAAAETGDYEAALNAINSALEIDKKNLGFRQKRALYLSKLKKSAEDAESDQTHHRK
jgi:tetratricopeptide (TPR) repeat protein